MATLSDVDRQAQFIRLILFILGAVLTVVGWARFAGAQPTARPAVPLEPAAAIVDAFRTHSVVAVTAGHGDARGYAFGRSLVTDPRIAAVVDDFVIEEGSARFQALADGFVRGDAVAIESIRPIWRETTQPGLGLDEPWETFFAAVRAANAAHAGGHQLRVLLGDPPIEWEQVNTKEDHRKWIEMPDWYPADLIKREVIEKKRHALLFYGDMHFQRKNMIANYESEGPAETIVYPSEAMGRFAIRDGKPDFSAQIPREQWKTLRAEDQFDAVLYTGAEKPTPVRPSTTRCADKADIQERMRRATLTGIGVNALKALCGL